MHSNNTPYTKYVCMHLYDQRACTTSIRDVCMYLVSRPSCNSARILRGLGSQACVGVGRKRVDMYIYTYSTCIYVCMYVCMYMCIRERAVLPFASKGVSNAHIHTYTYRLTRYTSYDLLLRTYVYPTSTYIEGSPASARTLRQMRGPRGRSQPRRGRAVRAKVFTLGGAWVRFRIRQGWSLISGLHVMRRTSRVGAGYLFEGRRRIHTREGKVL